MPVPSAEAAKEGKTILRFAKVENKLLNQKLTKLRVVPIGDTHVGDPGFLEKNLKEKLYSFKYEPTIGLLTGDCLNNGIKSSVSSCYEEVIKPGDDQIDYFCNIIEPYAEYFEAVIDGNHEYRTKKDVNLSLAKVYAGRLGIPYYGVHALLKFQFGKNDKGDPTNYVMYMHHGSGGGKARGGKTNKMVAQESIICRADVYVRSHSHVIDAFPTAVLDYDERSMSVFKRKMYHVSTGHWLDASDYAERAEMPALPDGTPDIYLYGDKKRIEILTS